MGSWECTQVFLEDYPYEPEFLGRIQELICQFDGLASYNGSTFDLPLLRSRFIMNGLVVPEIHHLDLLRPVRRLWRDSRVSCSLGTIEHEILGVQRIRDVAGMLIPGLYQEYLRAAIPDPGSFTSLSDVFAHHLSDHWSMIQLTQVLGTVTLALKQKSDSSAFEEWGITRLGLLRFLVPQGYSKNDLDYLAGLTLEQGSGFAQLLPRLLIGLGDYSSSLPWLKAGVGDGSLWSLERLLIYYEHREKNPSKALKELEDYWAIHPDSRMRLSQAQGARWNSRHQRLRRKSG